jgi:hypothetical protein
MPITITSKKEGFRRAGIAHPAAPTSYPEDAFTPEQLAAIQAEPMLVVSITTGDAPAADAAAEGPEPAAQAKSGAKKSK